MRHDARDARQETRDARQETRDTRHTRDALYETRDTGHAKHEDSLGHEIRVDVGYGMATDETGDIYKIGHEIRDTRQRH